MSGRDGKLPGKLRGTRERPGPLRGDLSGTSQNVSYAIENHRKAPPTTFLQIPAEKRRLSNKRVINNKKT